MATRSSWLSRRTQSTGSMADAIPQTERQIHDVSETWWWMHSRSNRSPNSNSLLTGKLTGNFVDSGPLHDFPRPIGKRIQWLAAKFPTQRNREFLEALQGILWSEQGI